MNKKYTEDLIEIITYGHEKIDPNEKIEVNLKDLLYVYSTLQEYMRFFHQADHYKDIQDIENFLGTVNDPKAFKMLKECIYEKMYDMFPEKISDMFGEGDFDHPDMPFYFKPKNQNQA